MYFGPTAFRKAAATIVAKAGYPCELTRTDNTVVSTKAVWLESVAAVGEFATTYVQKAGCWLLNTDQPEIGARLVFDGSAQNWVLDTILMDTGTATWFSMVPVAPL